MTAHNTRTCGHGEPQCICAVLVQDLQHGCNMAGHQARLVTAAVEAPNKASMWLMVDFLLFPCNLLIKQHRTPTPMFPSSLPHHTQPTAAHLQRIHHNAE